MSKETVGQPCPYFPHMKCEIKSLPCKTCAFYADYIKQENEKGVNNGGKR